MSQKILLLGGTGAIGIYLVPELEKRGYDVYITSRQARPGKKFIQGDAHDAQFLRMTLRSNKYEAVINFMNYSTSEFKEVYHHILPYCKHYIHLSSYRVYADSPLIKEDSPRLLDISKDDEFLNTDDYSLAKARQENILRGSSYTNWTIVRPAITYSKERFQLGTLEADSTVWRTILGLPVVIPQEMLTKKTTMTWAGDVARLIAKITLNKESFNEDYNICTAENHKWEEVASIYKQQIGLELRTTSIAKYMRAMGGGGVKYQVMYDRMYDRILDNSKILSITGEKQSNMKPLKVGLSQELEKFMISPVVKNIDITQQAGIDKLLGIKTVPTGISHGQLEQYMSVRYPLKSAIKSLLRPRTRLADLKRCLLVAKYKLRIRTRMKTLLYRARSLKYKSADGAIVTLSGYYNYGNIMQRYALQKFLEQQNLNFVSYIGVDTENAMNGDSSHRFKNTYEFIGRHVWTKNFDSRDKFKVYITGSDQVWRNWVYPSGLKDFGYFFLNFNQSQNARRIAYAASFGKENLHEAGIDDEARRYITPFINAIDHISMREDSGVDILRREWGISAIRTVDPTLLLKKQDYSKLIQASPQPLQPVNGVFAFILANDTKKRSFVKKVANAASQDVTYFQPYEEDVLPPVEQWLKGFNDATFVVTDSFHGTVFSLINNTQFVVVENTNGGVSRLNSLLEPLGLEDRIVLEKQIGTFSPGQLKPIKWREVNKKIEHMRKESANWLLSAIKE